MFAGIDIGSTSIEAVLLNDDQLASYHILLSGSDFIKGSRVASDKAQKRSENSHRDIAGIAKTQIMADITSIKGQAFTEIICAAHGAYFFHPDI